MAKCKPEYEYTLAVAYTDGTETKFYEIAHNRKGAFDAVYDELDDRIRDHVRLIRVVDRARLDFPCVTPKR